jgi:thiol-disulfide isomerase/thioredoxin
MKKWSVLLILFTLFFSVSKADINFHHGSWQEILGQAGKEDKLVFVDAYTTWCGPCKWMSANTFTDPAVSEYFNTHFVNAKIDMEKGEGPELQVKYNVTAYPTLLFINGAGELVHVAVGAMDAAKFLELGKNVQDPNFLSVANMRARYAAGETDRHFLAEYILAMRNLGQKFDEPLLKFREGMQGDAMLEEDNWKVFHAIFTKLDSDQAKYFLGHLEDFEKKYGEAVVTEKALSIYGAPLVRLSFQKGSPEEYQAARKVLVESGVKGAKVRAMTHDMGWHYGREEWKEYADVTIAYMNTKPEMTADGLNNIAWYFYEHVDNPKHMKLALEWVNRSVEMAPEFANMDTKTMVLKKLGRTEEAIATAEMAIAKAKETGADYSETEKALNEMRGK